MLHEDEGWKIGRQRCVLVKLHIKVNKGWAFVAWNVLLSHELSRFACEGYIKIGVLNWTCKAILSPIPRIREIEISTQD
jgi:hypothetical protein